MRRTKKEAEQTRADILDAAEILFADHGVKGASLEQIARRAGVTRGAVYWHFRDKSDLLSALRLRYRPPEMDLMESALAEGSPDPMGLLLRACEPCLRGFSQSDSFQRMFLILEQNPPEGGVPPEGDGFGLMVRIMTRAQDQGQLADDLTPFEAALSLSAQFRGLMTDWLMAGRSFDLPAIGTRLVVRHIRSLCRSAGPDAQD